MKGFFELYTRPRRVILNDDMNRGVAMRFVFVSTFLFAGGLAAASPGVSAPAAMALWQRAVAAAQHNASFVPASVHTSVTITDGGGRVRTSLETWSRIGIDGKGKIETTVVRSIKDGRNNTRAAQDEADRNPRRSRFDYALLPFMPQNRDQVKVSPTETTRTVAGASCSGFSFHLKVDGGRALLGTVWLDDENAAPRLMEFSFEPLPTGAREVTNRLTFTVTPNGDWRPGTLDTYAVGQLLFFRRVFRLEMRFSDYFAYPAAGAARGTSH